LLYRSKQGLENERGFSLIEVVLVVLIMGILTSIAAQKWSGALEQSRFEATRAEMDRLAQAIVGNPNLMTNGMRTDFGYFGDVGALPPSLDALVANPGLGTWNGPYIQSDFNQNPNDYKQDAWGTLYTYAGVTLTSNGSGTAVTKQIAGAVSNLTQNSILGSVTDGLDSPPGDSAASVAVAVRYPDGAGGATTATVNPNAGGSYAFSATVPVGNHPVTLTYRGDTLTRYVSVLPRSSAFVNFRMPSNLWSAGGGGSGGGGGLTYVSGSAASSNAGRNVSVDVANNSGATILITSIAASYAPAIYYETVGIDGNTVFASTNPRGQSGDTQTFPAININNGAVVTVELTTFKLCISGGCGNGDAQGVSFTLDFSDGSSVMFTVP